jgi:Carboxypeptidase regulatory-like domain
VDAATHKPPRAAVLEYHPLFPNADVSRITNIFSMAASSAVIEPDGTYHLVVLPGPGVVCVAASPRDSYAVAFVDDKDLTSVGVEPLDPNYPRVLRTAAGAGREGAVCLNRYNGLALIHPDKETQAQTVDIAVERAPAVAGTVIDPDDRPLSGVKVSGLTALPDDDVLPSASFTVKGLNPRGSRELFFYHCERELGKLLTLLGNQTDPLLHVRLEPCGSVTGRLVDKSGKPVSGVLVTFLRGTQWFASIETDLEGRFRTALVPGPKYSLALASERRLLAKVGELKVEAGGKRDLGDLTVGD